MNEEKYTIPLILVGVVGAIFFAYMIRPRNQNIVSPNDTRDAVFGVRG
jgi:hypothetical protein